MKRYLRAGALLLVLAVGTLAVASAQAKGPKPPPPTGQLSFGVADYYFGNVAVGNTATADFTLSYSYAGKTNAKVTLTLGASPGSFAISANSCPKGGLKPGSSCTITVSYAPTAVGGETATLTASADGVLGAVVGLTGTGVAPPPSLSIDDPSHAYGTPITFTVTMSRTSTTPVTFDWATADGTAVWVSGTTCGGFNGPNDYVGGSGTGTIAAGSTSTTISVETCSTGPGNMAGDTYFTVTISNPSGATITDGTGTGTLIAT